MYPRSRLSIVNCHHPDKQDFYLLFADVRSLFSKQLTDAIFRRMEIVQFKNGKYGIRKRHFLERLFDYGGSFKDFRPYEKQWRKASDHFFHDCQMESLEEVQHWLLKRRNDYVEKVL